MKTIFMSREFGKRLLISFICAPIIIVMIIMGGVLYNSLIVTMCCLMTYEWTMIVHTQSSLPQHDAKSPWNLLGLIYVCTPCICLLYIRGEPNGMALTLWLILCVWATDSAAYIVGSIAHGPKIAPKISPSKTWSGLAGGIIGSLIVSAGFLMWTTEELPFDPYKFSPALAVVAQLGDLLESLFKRNF